jgi:hypothetical protein
VVSHEHSRRWPERLFLRRLLRRMELVSRVERRQRPSRASTERFGGLQAISGVQALVRWPSVSVHHSKASEIGISVNPDQPPTYCSIDGCQKEAVYGLCWAHRKRKQRGKPLSEPLREVGLGPVVQLQRAALRYAEAEEDEEFKKAKDLLYQHGRRLRPKQPRAEIVQDVDKTPNQG